MSLNSSKNRLKSRLAILWLLVFAFNAISPLFSLSVYAQDELIDKDSPLNTSDEIIEFELPEVSANEDEDLILQKYREVEKYLKLFNAEEFSKSIESLKADYDRQFLLVEADYYLLKNKLEFESSLSDFSIPNPPVASDLQGVPMLSDLLELLGSEFSYSEFMLNARLNLQQSLFTLDQVPFSDLISKLEKRIDLERQKIEALQLSDSIEDEKWLSELIVEHRLTDFWLSFYHSLQNLKLAISTYLANDFSVLESKLLSEGNALAKLREFYTGELDRPLTDVELNLYQAYKAHHSEFLKDYFSAVIAKNTQLSDLMSAPAFYVYLDSDLLSVDSISLDLLREKNNFTTVDFLQDQYIALSSILEIEQLLNPSLFEKEQVYWQMVLPMSNGILSVFEDMMEALSPIEEGAPSIESDSEADEVIDSKLDESVRSLPEPFNEAPNVDEGVDAQPTSEKEGVDLVEEVDVKGEILPLDSSVDAETPSVDEAIKEEESLLDSESVEPEVLELPNEADVTEEDLSSSVSRWFAYSSGPLFANSPIDSSEGEPTDENPKSLEADADPIDSSKEEEGVIDKIVNAVEPIIDFVSGSDDGSDSEDKSEQDQVIDVVEGTDKLEDSDSQLPGFDSTSPDEPEEFASPESAEVSDSESQLKNEEPSSVEIPLDSSEEALGEPADSVEPLVDLSEPEVNSNEPTDSDESDLLDDPSLTEGSNELLDDSLLEVDNQIEDQVDIPDESPDLKVDLNSEDLLEPELLTDKEISEEPLLITEGLELDSSESEDVIHILEGDNSSLVEQVVIEDLILEDSFHRVVNRIKNKFSIYYDYATLTSEALFLSTDEERKDRFLIENSEFTIEQWDEWIAFMNKLALQNKVSDESVLQVAVLRFEPELCPSDLDDSTFSYESKNLATSTYLKDLSLIGSKKKEITCIVQSSDLSTKNKIGQTNYEKEIVDQYQINHENIRLSFDSSKDQPIAFLGSNDNKLFNFKAVDLNDVENEAKNTSFSMSYLADSQQLFTPASSFSGDLADQYIVYEASDHSQSIVYRWTSNPHRIDSFQLSRYHLFNQLDSSINLQISFDGLALKKRLDGYIEGYLGDDLIFIQSPYLLKDKDQNIINLSYEVIGDSENALLIQSDSAVSGPLVLMSDMTLFTQPSSLIGPSVHLKDEVISSSTFGFFNEDSFVDMAAYTYSSDESKASIKVYYGGELGFSDDPNLVLEDLEVSSLVTLKSSDINGDGVDDLVIGDPDFDKKRGRLLIIYGSLLGLSEDKKSSLSKEVDYMIRGSNLNQQFGYSFEIVDLNLDQKIDLLVSAPDYESRGVIHFFNGESFDFSSKDYVEISSAQSTEDIFGPIDERRFGEYFLLADLNEDASDDLISSSFAEAGGFAHVIYQVDSSWARPVDLSFYSDSSYVQSLMINDFNGDGKQELLLAFDSMDLSPLSEDAKLYFIDLGIDSVFTQKDITACHQECLLERSRQVIQLPVGEKLKSLHHLKEGKKFKYLMAESFSTADQLVRLSKIQLDDSSEDLKDWSIEHEVVLPNFAHFFVAPDWNNDDIEDLMTNYYDTLLNNASSLIVYAPQSFIDLVQLVDEHSAEEELQEEEELEELKDEVEVKQDDEEDLEEEDQLEVSSGEDSIEEDVIKKSDPIVSFDLSTPDNPEIECSGVESGIFSDQDSYSCTWSDTTGPSKGIFRYCVDTDNICTPDIQTEDRLVTLIGLVNHHHYLRVQNIDEGGESDVVSFDFAIDHLPVISEGISDGGSSSDVPTKELESVEFSVVANDHEKDDYYLLICRTGDEPIFDESGLPVCAGDSNMICRSEKTTSDEKATCLHSVQDEEALNVIWYGYVCSAYGGNPICSEVNQGSGETGSPFYVYRTPTHENLIITDQKGEAIEPGDRLRFMMPTSRFKNIASGQRVDLYVCSSNTTSFDLDSDTCVEGTLICSSSVDYAENQLIRCDEAEGDLINPIPSPATQKNIKVYFKLNNDLVEGVSTQVYDVIDSPSVLNSYSDLSDVSLVAGGSDIIRFTADITDHNGWDDLFAVEGRFFNAAQVNSDCDASQNNCYLDQDCSFDRYSETSLKASCEVKVFYNADASDKWRFHMTPLLKSGYYFDLPISDQAKAIPKITAINKEEISLSYPLAFPGEISKQVEVKISNLGNQPVDLLVEGTELKGKKFSIDRSAQKWSTESGFDYDKSGYPLVENAVAPAGSIEGCVDLNLPVVRSATTPETRSIFWKIKIPSSQKSDVYDGKVFFEPTEINQCSN